MERKMWSDRSAYQRRCCLQLREETRQKPAEEVTDGAMVGKGEKSLCLAVGFWYSLMHKGKYPSPAPWADTSQQEILLSKRKSCWKTVGADYKWSSCFHPAYLKTRYNKKGSVLGATHHLDFSHTHRNCPPPPFTSFLGHKTISQGHGNNDAEIQSAEIKHMKLMLITAKLCHLSAGSSLFFKTIQQSY